MKLILIFLIFFSSINAEVNIKEIAVFSAKDAKNRKHFELILTVIQELLNKNSKKENINLKFKLNLYNDKKEIYKRYLEEDLLLMILSPYYYIKDKKLLDKNKEDILHVTMNNQKREQYYLIANKKAKQPMKNLSKYKISMLGGNNAALHWFKSYIYKEHKKPFKTIIPNLKKLGKESKIVYDVFFNKNHLGLISKAGYELLYELNPQIKKHTVILKKSKEIYLSMYALTNLKTKKEDKNNFMKILANINSLVKNDLLSASASITSVNILEKKDLKALEEFYTKLFILENKYEK